MHPAIRTVVGASLALASVVPALGKGPFTDLPASHPYAGAIGYLQREGVLNGDTPPDGSPTGTFRPDATINRAEFVKIVVRGALGHPARDFSAACFGLNAEENLRGERGSFVFPDVESDAWYAVDLCAAYDIGIIAGYPDGTFRPDCTINFAEAAKILAQAFELGRRAPDDPWYRPHVDALSETRAIPPSIRSFGHEITRGEMAEMVVRLMRKDASKPSRAYEELAR